MKSPLGPALCACLFVPTPTHAQSTLVSPAYFASHEADSYSFYRFAQFGSTVTRHHQAVHDLGSAFKKRLYALGYRRDRGHPYQAVTVPSWWVQLEVALSTSPTTSARMATTFTSNEGKDRVVASRAVSAAGSTVYPQHDAQTGYGSRLSAASRFLAATEAAVPGVGQAS